MASVCTGASILAKTGLLRGLNSTIDLEDIDEFSRAFPGVEVLGTKRWIDEGRIITSAGVSAGLDMSLDIVSKLLGRELAERTARQMDYHWQEEA